MNDKQRASRPGRGAKPESGHDGRRRDRAAKPPPSLAETAGAALPKWVKESVARVTPKARVAGALQALEEAAAAFMKGGYRRALDRARNAKELSPREPSIRELLGLSAYRLGQWQVALQELRTYRRLAGDTRHLPVEMDALRALDRPADVEAGWTTLQEKGGSPATVKEGRVVYGSFLLDRGDARRAWEVTNPHRLRERPFEEDLRQWYVAARAAAALHDQEAARRLRDAIQAADPGFPGLEELDSVIDS